MKTLRWISSISITALIGIGLPEAASTQPAPSPTITIRVAQPQSVSYNIGRIFTGQVPATITLQVVAGGGRWWFIRFEAIPQGMEVIGDLLGAATGSALSPSQWYPFRQSVTLTALVEPGATSPLNLRYVLGRVSEGQREPRSLNEAQQRVQERLIRIEGKEHFVKFFWPTERPVITANPARMDFLVYENTYYVPQELNIESTSAGWSFIRLRGLPDYLKVRLAETAVPEAATLAPGSELTDEQWYGFNQIMKLQVSLREKISSASDLKLTIESGEAELANDSRSAAIAAINSNTIVLHGAATIVPISLKPPSLTTIAAAFLASTLWKVLVGVGLLALSGGMLRWGWRYYQGRQARPVATAGENPEPIQPMIDAPRPGSAANVPAQKRRWLSLSDLIGRWRRRATADSADSTPANRLRTLTLASGQITTALSAMTSSANASAELAQVVQSHTKQLREMEHKLIALEGHVLNTYKIKDRVAELEQELEHRTLSAPAPDLEERIAGKLETLAEELKANERQQIRRLSGQIQSLEQGLAELRGWLQAQQVRGEEMHRRLEEYRQQLHHLMTERPSSAGSSIASDVSQGPQDALYARLLGLIFAGTIDSLHKESFDAAIQRAGQMLNRFFQEELPLARNLDALTTQAEELVAVLEQVVSKGSTMNKDAYGELRLPAERGRRLCREITSLKTQLQQRQIELDLQIRVSTHPTGHAIFLEELGRAIKQAIDKFADPQAYIQCQLDRFITRDVVGVIDVCDRDVAPPGENDELEQLLRALCQAARLKSILPIAMEPYQPSEHNPVQWVSGHRSQTVARTLRRGFYYNDQVLRKADVIVYK